MSILRITRRLCALAAMLLLSGCYLDTQIVKVFHAPASSIHEIFVQLGNRAGTARGSIRIGGAAARPSSSFSTLIAQDVRDAQRGTPVGGTLPVLADITPSYDRVDVRTPDDQGDSILSEGKTTLKGETLNLLNLQDRGRVTSLVFVGGTYSSSSSGSGTQAIGAQQPGVQPGGGPSSVVVASGDPIVGGLTAGGRYEYTGAFAWTKTSAFSSIYLGTSRLTVDFGADDTVAFSLAASTVDNQTTSGFDETASLNFSQSSGFSFNRLTGRFSFNSETGGAASQANGFQAGGGGYPAVPFIFDGIFSGAGGQAVTGVFTTTGSIAAEFSGGIVASGAEIVSDEYRLYGGAGFAGVSLDVLGRGGAAPAQLLASNYTALYGQVNSPSQNVKTKQGLLPLITALTPGAAVQVAGGINRSAGIIDFLERDVQVTVLEDPDGLARLLLVDGTGHPAFGSFFIAGGAALPGTSTAPTSGVFVYEGAQLVGRHGAFGAPGISGARISVDFGASSFSYASLAGGQGAQVPVVSGSGTITSADGTLAATPQGFTITPPGGVALAATIRGRFTGGWRALSGLFATTGDTGAQYGGGFVAYLPNAADTVRVFGDDAGIGTIANINLGSGASNIVTRAIFVSAAAQRHVDAVNAAATSSTSLLRSITPDFGAGAASPDSATGTLTRPQATFSHAGQSVNADIFLDTGGQARLVVIHGGANTPVVSAIFAGGTTFSGQLSGDYRYGGGFFFAPRATPHDIAKGRFTLTANFGAGQPAFAFQGSTTGTGKQSSLVFATGSAVLDVADVANGRFSVSGGFFRAGSGSAGAGDSPAIIEGVLAGAGGLALSGVFATTGTTSSGTQYAGGFVGGGLVTARLDAAGIVSSSHYRLDGAAGPAPLVAVGAGDLAGLVQGANNASSLVADAGLLANLAPVYSGQETQAGLATRRTGSLGLGGRNYAVTRYAVPAGAGAGQGARLLVIQDSANALHGTIIVAGGSGFAAATPLSGDYSFVGEVISAARSQLHTTTRANVAIAIDIAAGSVTFTPGAGSALPRLSGTGAIDTASGRLSGAAFAFTPAGASSALPASLEGLVHGATTSLSGVFATTNSQGARYAGGFVGAAAVNARRRHVFAASGGRQPAGIGEVDAWIFAGAGAGVGGATIFLVEDIAGQLDAANTAHDQTREAALFIDYDHSLGTSPVALGRSGNFERRTVTVTQGGASAGGRVYRYPPSGSAIAGFVVAGASGAVPSHIAAGGAALTGAALSGRYQWEGVFAYGAWSGGSLGVPSAASEGGVFTLAADFSNGTFTIATVGARDRGVIAGSGSISAADGGFSATGLDFTPAGGTRVNARLYGRVFGADGAAVAGLFATQGSAAGDYAGGLVGAGAVTAAANAAGIVSSSAYRFDGASSPAAIVATGPGLAAQVAALNSPALAGRDAVILTNLAPVYGTQTPAGPGARVAESTGTLTHGGGQFPVKRYAVDGGAARILVIDGSGVASAGSLVVAGGTAYDNTPALAGAYSFDGTVFSGAASALHTTTRSSVAIALDFTAGTFLLTPGSTAIATPRLAGSGTLDAARGTFAGAGVTFTPAGATSPLAASLEGLVHGAGLAVSGVFTTTAQGTAHGGGFIGTAPQLASRVAAPSGGYVIGRAARGTFGDAHSQSTLLFLGGDYDELAAELNVASQAARGAALLSRIGATRPTAATTDNIHKYTGLSIAYDGGTAAATAYEDTDLVARLFVVDGSGHSGVEDLFLAGGRNLTGTLSGGYEYEGVFVSAAGGALRAIREGDFELDANFTSSGGTFTFTGVTRNAGGVVTSTLTLTSSGTFKVSSGRLVATGAVYNEYSAGVRGDDRTALIEGLVLGAGGTGVAGVFTTTGAVPRHAGGFAGAVLGFASVVDNGFTGRTGTPDPDEGFAQSARFIVPGGVAGQTLFFTPKLGAVLGEANNPTVATRTAALLAQVSGTGGNGTAGTALGALITGRSFPGIAYKGQSIAVAVHEDRYGLARIAAVDASSVTGANAASAASFVVAGGAPFSSTGSGLAGEYTWQGLQFVGESNALNSVTSSTITFTANFTGGSTAFTATTDSGATVRLGGSGTVDLATGRLSGTGFTLTTGGASAATTFQGRLVGVDAISLSGVFANNVALNSKFYAGAVVATGARGIDILSGAFNGVATNGPVLGRGTYALAGRAAADSLFVVAGGSDAVARASHASKTIREASLLANINPSFRTASSQTVPAILPNTTTFNLVTRPGTSTIDGGTYNVTAYEDGGGVASLLVVDGGTQLLASGGVAATSIPTSGAYTWDGIQTISAAGSIATASLGRFRLTTTFNGAADVAFIYDGRTGSGVAIANTTLDARGKIVVSAGTFTSSTRFDLAILGAPTITDGLLSGRLFGAGASAVAGLFLTTNTSETRYAGGFVGGGPEAGRAIVRLPGLRGLRTWAGSARRWFQSTHKAELRQPGLFS